MRPTLEYSRPLLSQKYQNETFQPQVIDYRSGWNKNQSYSKYYPTKGQSVINYIPYERKIIDYETVQRVERVPKVRKILQYRDQKIVEEIPMEVTVVDYLAVQNIRQYEKQIIPEKTIQMVPVEKKVKRVQYVPVARNIVHDIDGHREFLGGSKQNFYFSSNTFRQSQRKPFQSGTFGQQSFMKKRRNTNKYQRNGVQDTVSYNSRESYQDFR